MFQPRPWPTHLPGSLASGPRSGSSGRATSMRRCCPSMVSKRLSVMSTPRAVCDAPGRASPGPWMRRGDPRGQIRGAHGCISGTASHSCASDTGEGVQMRYTGVRRVSGPRADVWQVLHDREVLRAGIPGCERLIPLGDHEYVAILAGRSETYRGLLTVVDGSPGTELRVELAGRGRCGTLEVAIDVQLCDGGPAGTTSVLCDARVHVDGVERRATSARKDVVGDFLHHLDRALPRAGALT